MSNFFEPQYIDADDLIRYMRGKIVEGLGDTEFSREFLDDMCAKGESVVERDFSKIYLLPFQGYDDTPFTAVPLSSQAYISNLCVIQAALLLLKINFGADSVTTGANFIEYLTTYYNIEKRKILPKGTDGLYILNPILGLAINTLSYTGQVSAPTPAVIDPLLGRNNAQKAVDRLTIVDKAVGLNLSITDSPIPNFRGRVL